MLYSKTELGAFVVQADTGAADHVAKDTLPLPASKVIKLGFGHLTFGMRPGRDAERPVIPSSRQSLPQRRRKRISEHIRAGLIGFRSSLQDLETFEKVDGGVLLSFDLISNYTSIRSCRYIPSTPRTDPGI